MMKKPSRWYAGAAVVSSLLLVACGSDGGGSSTSTISGTAATGAPMVGASKHYLALPE